MSVWTDEKTFLLKKKHPPSSARQAVDGLRDNQCRWPIGDPKSADFKFCFSKKEPGNPYCAEHAKRAYQALLGAESVSWEKYFDAACRRIEAATKQKEMFEAAS